MRRLVLVRHGETLWNSERRLQGQQDVPLSDDGTMQVRRLAPSIRALSPSWVVCSPLRRCRRTAELLGVGVDTWDARWIEADLGRWTGLTRADLIASGDHGFDRWRAGRADPPGGETLDELERRVAGALADLGASVVRVGAAPVDQPDATRADETVLVVTHGGPIRAAVRLLLGLPRGRLVPVAPASASVLAPGDSGTRLVAYNLRSAAHLADPRGRVDPAADRVGSGPAAGTGPESDLTD